MIPLHHILHLSLVGDPQLSQQFTTFNSNFFFGAPGIASAFQIYKNHWKYDFDKKSIQEIEDVVKLDPRPRWCNETFGGLKRKSVLELGPADGYNTLALEKLGAKVTAIETNVDAFFRCLILKNAFNMNANYWIGNFMEFLKGDNLPHIDIMYASGVLYHLLDPIDFLDRCSKYVRKLFLWTHYYNDRSVKRFEAQADHPEAKSFKNRKKSLREYKGKTFTYYEKTYDTGHVKSLHYIGGINPTCNWMSRDDLLASIEAAGYTILKTVEDEKDNKILPSINIFAELQ